MAFAFLLLLPSVLAQLCPIKHVWDDGNVLLSALSCMVATSRMLLLTTGNFSSVTEKVVFKFDLFK